MCRLTNTEHVSSGGEESIEKEFELCDKARMNGNVRCTSDDESSTYNKGEVDPASSRFESYPIFAVPPSEPAQPGLTAASTLHANSLRPRGPRQAIPHMMTEGVNYSPRASEYRSHDITRYRSDQRQDFQDDEDYVTARPARRRYFAPDAEGDTSESSPERVSETYRRLDCRIDPDRRPPSDRRSPLRPSVTESNAVPRRSESRRPVIRRRRSVGSRHEPVDTTSTASHRSYISSGSASPHVSVTSGTTPRTSVTSVRSPRTSFASAISSRMAVIDSMTTEYKSTIADVPDGHAVSLKHSLESGRSRPVIGEPSRLTMINPVDQPQLEGRRRQSEVPSAIGESDLGTIVEPETFSTRPETQGVIEDFRQGIDAGDLAGTALLLEHNLESLAHGNLEWLLEVRDIGYTYQQIAEVLIEEKSQSPWIYFSPPHLISSIQDDFHRDHCVHGWKTAPDTLKTHITLQGGVLLHDNMRLESENLRQIVTGLCGLGGVVPLTGEKSEWNGQVSFQAANTIAEITYDSTQRSESHRLSKILKGVQNAVNAFAAVSGWLQEQKLCCNSFTALVQTKPEGIVEIVPVPMGLIDEFRRELPALLPALEGEEAIDEQTVHVAQISHKILNLFCHGELMEVYEKDNPGSFSNIFDILDSCALSAQALGLALLTYSNAHVGHVHPFFLDGPVMKVRLLGAGEAFSQMADLTLRPVTLTCMGDMLGDVVSVFSTWNTFGDHKCDLLASPQDILDTWGPGRLVFNHSVGVSVRPYNLCAIEIGGGTIQRTQADSDLLHWHTGECEIDHLLPLCLDVNGKVLVGGWPKPKENCPLNHTKSLQMRCSEALLRNLGTGPDEWRLAERQLGMQGGQYVTLSFTNIWVRREGTTLKQTYLDYGSNTLWVPFLESFWAVQVSLCTGVAQRVRVREMLSDVMLPFMKARFPVPQEWDLLLEDDMIIENFRSPNFETWLDRLSPRKRTAVAEIVNYILRKLRKTGFDKGRNEFVIASVSPEDPCRCFRIQCQRDHIWARALEDSENCATYAYVTTKCLETPDRKCRNLEEAPWLQKSPAFLATAVCPHEPLVEKDMGPSAYSLREGVRYWMGRPGTRLVAELTKTSRLADLRLDVSLSKTPEGFIRRFERLRQPENISRRLREKGLEKHAEEVFLLTVG